MTNLSQSDERATDQSHFIYLLCSDE